MQNVCLEYRGLFAVCLAISIVVHISAARIISRDVRPKVLLTPPLDVILSRRVEVVASPKRLALPKPQIRRQAEQHKALQRPRDQPVTSAEAQATPSPQPIALSEPINPSAFTLPESVEPEVRPPKADAVAAAQSFSQVPRETAHFTPASFNAAYLRNPIPRYPIAARRSGVVGTVLLKVRVTAEGRPAEVQVDQSSGSSVLDNAALEAVRHWQFVAARREQKPVESSVMVPIVFKLE